MAGKRYEIYRRHERRFLKNILRNLFIWEGLPETIDARALEEQVLFGGYTVGFKWHDDIIVAQGALSGVGLYQQTTTFTSANHMIIPPVKREIGKDCAVCYNTSNFLFPEKDIELVDIYADLLAEVTLSMKTSVKNSKVCIIPLVKDDKEAIRVSNVLRQMYDGDSYALAYEIDELDGKTIYPIKARDNIVVSELADARRCILADFFSEIGVKVSAVDKRERVNLMEMDSNEQQLKLSCDTRLRPRERWSEEMNKILNTNISVKFNEKEILNYGLQPQDIKGMATSVSDK